MKEEVILIVDEIYSAMQPAERRKIKRSVRNELGLSDTQTSKKLNLTSGASWDAIQLFKLAEITGIDIRKFFRKVAA